MLDLVRCSVHVPRACADLSFRYVALLVVVTASKRDSTFNQNVSNIIQAYHKQRFDIRISYQATEWTQQRALPLIDVPDTLCAFC